MEFEFGLPYFGENDNVVYQEFSVYSRGYRWRGRAMIRGKANLPVNTLKELIEESVSDARRGYVYVRVKRINGYRCRVSLDKDTWRYTNTSRIEIRIFDENDEKIHVRLEPI